LRATYYARCAWVDHLFGRLVKGLKEAGIYDETAIFFFSDHGDFTGDYGLVEKNQNTFEDCLVRVPFIVKPPADFAAKPGVSHALVELIDMCATVEDFAGLEPDHTHFGKSLAPVLAGQRQEHRDAVFAEGGRLVSEQHTRERESTAATRPESLYWPRVGLQIQDTTLHGKAVMCRTHRFKYVRRLYEEDELYDLERDPGELHNVAKAPASRESLLQLRERLLTFYQETCDVAPFATDDRWPGEHTR